MNAEILNLAFVLSCSVGGASDKEPACHCWRCKRCGFNPWVRKISWRRAQPSSPVFLPEESPWTEEPPGYSLTWLKGLSMHALCVQWSRYTSDVCCNYFYSFSHPYEALTTITLVLQFGKTEADRALPLSQDLNPHWLDFKAHTFILIILHSFLMGDSK